MRKIVEEIVTDKLDQSDWNILLALDLKPVHKAYIEEFRWRNNEPATLQDIWESVEGRLRVHDLKVKRIFFETISSALRTRKTCYRIRSVLHEPRQNKFRIAKVVLV